MSEHDEDLIQLFQENFSQRELERELCEDITGQSSQGNGRGNEPMLLRF